MKKFCVYKHVIAGSIVYVGSGNIHRPYTEASRGQAWHEATNGMTYSIEIISFHGTREAAYKAEKYAIKAYRPIGNIVHCVDNETDEAMVTVAIPRKLYRLVKCHAKETDLKFKAVVRIALEEYVSNRTAAVPVENAQ